METEPRGRRRSFTDDELRQDLAAGLTGPQIAQKHGVSRQAVNKRVNQLEQTTTAAVVAPEESRRFASRKLDAMEELLGCLATVHLLKDACERYLQEVDPAGNPTGRYDVGPRSHEIDVIYWPLGEDGERATRKPQKATLQALLERVEASGRCEVVSAESRHADPRTLVLSTCAEVRQIVTTCADLAKMLADARLMEQFRQSMLAEIAKESPEVAQRIAEAVRRSLVVCSAFRGPDSLPGGSL